MVARIETIYKTKLVIADSKKITKDGLLIAEGFASISEDVSPNGYRYRSQFWPKVLSDSYVKDMINQRESLGTIEHPEDDNAYMMTPYKDASHFVSSLTLKKYNNHMAPYAQLAVLNTELGCTLKALCEAKIPVGVSTRGLGETLSDSVSKYIDEENYRYITHDVVRNPNFSSLRLKAVTDSMLSSPMFKELTQTIKFRDSGEHVSDRDKTIQDIKKMLSEVTAKMATL